MREEDRLGKVISHIQQHRSAMEQENRAMQSQLRLLADEASHLNSTELC